MSKKYLSRLMIIIICSPLLIAINQPTIALTNIYSLPSEISDTINQETNLSVLVVLMEFGDDPHNPLHTVQHYSNLFFSDESYSIRQYYLNTSYGAVELTGDVLGWFQAEEDLSYYGEGGRIPPGQDIQPQILALEALNHAIDEQKDPRNYDLFVIIHSGDGQEYSGNSDDIWSHQWGIYHDSDYVPYSMNHEYVDYGTPSHELGHALLFPDLYDFRNYEHIFTGPYGMMGRGESHFSIWNKYYSKISNPASAQFLTADFRLQISNYSRDTITTINPIGLETPQGVLWLEVGWNSTGYANSSHGSGWTISVREDIDYDKSLPKHGLVVAKINVGPRTYTQVEQNEYPPWNVVDAHPETAENKDDAAFSLATGDIGTFVSEEGWAVQILEKFANQSYQVRVTNETNIPQVTIQNVNHSVNGSYDLTFNVDHPNSTISTEISIDNGPWTAATPTQDVNVYTYSWDTTQEHEGSHIVRARAIDNVTIPYIGYSSFVTVNIDNINGSILVVDDDLGRDAEISVLAALDDLGLTHEYEVIRTSSFTEAEISAEELALYDKILWIGNPEISPLSNSHINYAEFKQIEKYLKMDLGENRSPGIIVMSSYTIFDFSNQGAQYQNEFQAIFQAQSPVNFRSPVSNLIGSLFLEGLPSFTLGNTDTLRATRSSDGEVVGLMAGATPILIDSDPQFPSYPTKGYIVDDGQYKLITYLFQPAMVPSDILLLLLNSSLSYLDQPANGSLISTTTTDISTPIDPIQILSVILIGGLGISTLVYFFRPKPRKGDSYWLNRDK
ncbi:MAG: immune inhibitor A domain-containing protein [Candidatus Hodarchaeales archaeon]